MPRLIVALSFLFILSTGYSQNNFALEYLISTDGKDQGLQSLLVFSKDGNTFSRYKRLSDGVTWYQDLRLTKQPQIDYQIFDDTYLEIPDKQLTEYQLSILGNEVVDKKNCVKISLVAYKGGEKITVWVTKDLPSYESYLTCFVNTIDLRKLNIALKKINVSGFPIKIVYGGRAQQTYEFVSAKIGPLEDSMFSLENFKKAELRSSKKLKKKDQISEEQYKQMKIEEEKAKQQFKKRD